MKTTPLLVLGLALVGGAHAADALQAPLPKPALTVSTNMVKQVPPNVYIPTNNTKIEFSGVAVQAVKHNPLQLVNPAAPARYGSGEQNTVRDPNNGRATGIKIFSFSW